MSNGATDTPELPLQVFLAKSGQPIAIVDGVANLQDRVTYRFELASTDDGERFASDLDAHPAAERVGEHPVWMVCFRNFVGYARIGSVEVVVASGQFGTGEFSAMLDDMVRISAALPFGFRSPTEFRIGERELDRTDVLYHAFAYLRWAMRRQENGGGGLPEALELIARNPHRALVTERRDVPLGNIRRATARDARAIVQRPSVLEPVAAGSRDERTARAAGLVSPDGRAWMPSVVAVQRPRNTFDTPPNRFTRHALTTFAEVASRMLEHLGRRRSSVPGLEDEARAIRDQLRAELRRSMWSEVGAMRDVPASSTVLQRQAGYRDVLRHFRLLSKGMELPPDGEEWQRMLDAGDAATLYEVWTYLVTAQEISRRLGPGDLHLDTSLADVGPERAAVRRGLGIRWGSVELWYNRQFSASSPAKWKSASLPLRPDITLRVAETSYGLDAKFRARTVDRAAIEAEGDDTEGDTDLSEARGRSFVRSDIYKMHAYRDALAIESAWALYPGSVGAGIEAWPSVDTPAVGAVVLRPEDTSAMQTLLTRLGVPDLAD